MRQLILLGIVVAALTLPPAAQQVRYLAWSSNDTVVAVPPPASSFPTADGTAACLADRRIVMPCDGVKLRFNPDVDVIGPIAFTADRVYFASPNDNGMVALWSADLRSRRARRISPFARDAYAPSIAATGTVMFKVQSYRTHLADVAAAGGATRQLTTFQSETPSYHPTKPLTAFTYGTWRRVLDDSKYPDIFTKAIAGESSPVQLTNDPSNKTQPAWSPDGQRVAFTVWSYDAVFWSFETR